MGACHGRFNRRKGSARVTSHACIDANMIDHALARDRDNPASMQTMQIPSHGSLLNALLHLATDHACPHQRTALSAAVLRRLATLPRQPTIPTGIRQRRP